MTARTLFNREDTLLGVCEGIGEDFGFNAQYLRVALAAMIFWNPLAALGTYATLAVAVLLSRTLFPIPTVAAETAATEIQPPLKGENDAASSELAIAA